jgi:hypothetical protein
VSASARLASALEVAFTDPGADSVRAHYVSADGTDAGTTPWFAARGDSLLILGLKPATRYSVTLQSKRGVAVADGATATQTTAPLPAALTSVTMTVLAGGAPSAGYTLANVNASDGHGYAVAFDSAGTIRWYHDIGAATIVETKQQKNGDFTMFVQTTTINTQGTGAYLEVTPGGDSVRSVQALGSPYTDAHELVVTYDANGTRAGDYLFGYDLRPTDLTSRGGSASDMTATHQVLRIAPSGAVDTLAQGWTLWRVSDFVDPLSTSDIDHPNSIAFDRDGGIIVSYRNLDAIVKIDPVTHAIVWQLGGARNQFRFVGDPLGGFGGQHNAQILPNGHLLVFDNGTTHTPQTSRAVEYALDPIAGTATMVWQYLPQPPVFNYFTGSVQRLGNGNTVVSWTLTGIVDEVTPDGSLRSRVQIVRAPGAPASIYRATHIASLYRYVDP